MENNQQCNREKWLNEKKLLFKQAKEAEDQRNKEMRKWTEEREHYSKLQSEMVRTVFRFNKCYEVPRFFQLQDLYFKIKT